MHASVSKWEAVLPSFSITRLFIISQIYRGQARSRLTNWPPRSLQNKYHNKTPRKPKWLPQMTPSKNRHKKPPQMTPSNDSLNWLPQMTPSKNRHKKPPQMTPSNDSLKWLPQKTVRKMDQKNGPKKWTRKMDQKNGPEKGNNASFPNILKSECIILSFFALKYPVLFHFFLTSYYEDNRSHIQNHFRSLPCHVRFWSKKQKTKIRNQNEKTNINVLVQNSSLSRKVSELEQSQVSTDRFRCHWCFWEGFLILLKIQKMVGEKTWPEWVLLMGCWRLRILR